MGVLSPKADKVSTKPEHGAFVSAEVFLTTPFYVAGDVLLYVGDDFRHTDLPRLR
jgi:hypothetical protein